MRECLAIERRKPDRETCGVVAGRHGKIRPTEVWGTADRDKQIVDQSEVRHFLDGNAEDELAPSRDHRGFARRKPVLHAALEAERGIEIRAQKVVLDLGGFGQYMDQLLAQCSGYALAS